MKTIIADNMCLHLRSHSGEDALWINGINKFILNKDVAFILNGIMDSYLSLNVGTLRNNELVEAAIVKAVDYFKCKPDFVRVYVWFILDNIAKYATSSMLHPLLLNHHSSSELLSPTRMDLALTYKCNNQCYFCYADCPRVTTEMDTGEWKAIIDKLSLLDVTTLNLTGGEPVLRNDLIELMSYAKDRFILGLTTNGRLLSTCVCEKLKRTGLWYTQVTIHSLVEDIHDCICGKKGAWQDTVNGIRNSLLTGIHTTTNTTLMRNNYLEVVDFIEFIYGLGVRDICFNSLLISGKGRLYEKDDLRLTHEELRGILKTINVTVKGLSGMKVSWLTPTCYNRLNPIELGLGEKGCSACGFNMTVEPDGRVIPCQSWLHESCGNILTDNWETIWESEVAQKNKLSHAIEECKGCKWIDKCKGACPLDRSWVEDIKCLATNMAC
jgi:radical SAM protein with 4Fe4S-binding SPASM domain